MTPIDALQAALAVEHQVVYGYGIVGARMSSKADAVTRDECVERLDAHRALRDELASLVRDAGAAPVTSAPAYDLPFPVRSAADAVGLGVLLEDATAGALWDVAQTAAPGSAPRRTSVTQLAEAARWAARWRESGYSGDDRPALPGQPSSSQSSTSPTSSSSPSTTPSGSTS